MSQSVDRGWCQASGGYTWISRELHAVHWYVGAEGDGVGLPCAQAHGRGGGSMSTETCSLHN